MIGLNNIAEKVQGTIRESSCLCEKGEIIHQPEFERILNSFPVWVLVYDARKIQACFINHEMANAVGSPPGFIEQENEYHTVHHCDAASAMNRFKAFDHFNSGEVKPLHSIGTLFLKNESAGSYNDVAAPIAIDQDGKTTYYAHFYSELNSLTLVNAYGLCDPGHLSPRQREVFAQLLKGISLHKIADKLGISIKTLEKHTHAIYSLSGVPNQRALMEACSRF